MYSANFSAIKIELSEGVKYSPFIILSEYLFSLFSISGICSNYQCSFCMFPDEASANDSKLEIVY